MLPILQFLWRVLDFRQLLITCLVFGCVADKEGEMKFSTDFLPLKLLYSSCNAGLVFRGGSGKIIV